MTDLLLDVRTWAALIVTGALLAAGYQGRKWVAPDQKVPQPDTLVKTEQITKRDTVTETVVDRVVQYDTVAQTDTVWMQVPSDMTIKGVIPPSPVDVNSQRVRLTFFDPDAQRFTQDFFELPQQKNRISVTASTRAWGKALETTVEGLYTRQIADWWIGRVWLQGGAGYRLTSTQSPMAGPYGTVGLRYELRW